MSTKRRVSYFYQGEESDLIENIIAQIPLFAALCMISSSHL